MSERVSDYHNADPVCRPEMTSEKRVNISPDRWWVSILFMAGRAITNDYIFIFLEHKCTRRFIREAPSTIFYFNRRFNPGLDCRSIAEQQLSVNRWFKPSRQPVRVPIDGRHCTQRRPIHFGVFEQTEPLRSKFIALTLRIDTVHWKSVRLKSPPCSNSCKVQTSVIHYVE